MVRISLILILALFGRVAMAYDPSAVLVTGHELPKEFEGVGVEEHLGHNVDLGLEFVSDNGEKVHLGKFFESGKPVLLAMVYYSCPNLCNFHLNGLTDALKQLKWTAGQDFQLVAVSINAKEGPDVAAKKKANYIKAYGRPESADGWHFLTGTVENINALSSQVGFKFKWIEEQKQYSHTSVSYVLTPGGKISRYIYGIGPDAQTVKLSLLEASSGKIGSMMDQVLLYCFHFDPSKNKYTLYAWNLMRVGGVTIVALLALFLIPVWRKASRVRPTT
jgi:protein SCO1/2